jgi:predicted regulator of Ras-like GTPase activity (Roadblock/LC7/MglB family)
MNEAFATLSKTDGVVGVVVFDEQGGCIANEMPPPYEPILLFEVLKRLWSAFSTFSSLDSGAVSSFCLDCEEGSVVVRRVEQHWVLALTHSEVNMSMLNVAMNVVVLNMSRSAQPTSGTLRTARAAGDSLSRSIVTQSMSSDPGAQEIPPDAVDRALVQQLVVIYQEYMGPAAKAVIKQQLSALGVTSRTLRRAQFGDLTARLTSKIPVPERQREFTTAVQKFRERVLLT